MHKDELPYWLQSLVICGRENDEDEDEGQENENDDDGDEGEEDESQDEGGDDLNAKVAALEKALKDERQLRRKAERDAKRKKRQETSQKQGEEEAETQKQLQVAQERTQRLAAGLLRKEIDTAIEKVARDLGFIDPTDAQTDAIRREIDADQDEDDPTDIDIDMDSVKDAVKDLAAKKKHLVGNPPPESRSGSKFRKKTSKVDEDTDEAALRDRYPSLR